MHLRLSLFRISLVLAFCSGTLSAQQAAPAPQASRTIVLTPVHPSEGRVAGIVAPGYGFHGYNMVYLDTRAFRAGGVLEIEVQVAPNSRTAGSFDLYPAGFAIPSQGQPNGTLSGAYNLSPGQATHMEIRFPAGQVYVFGLEGNWDSPKGATGQAQFTVHVLGNGMTSKNDDDL